MRSPSGDQPMNAAVLTQDSTRKSFSARGFLGSMMSPPLTVATSAAQVTHRCASPRTRHFSSKRHRRVAVRSRGRRRAINRLPFNHSTKDEDHEIHQDIVESFDGCACFGLTVSLRRILCVGRVVSRCRGDLRSRDTRTPWYRANGPGIRRCAAPAVGRALERVRVLSSSTRSCCTDQADIHAGSGGTVTAPEACDDWFVVAVDESIRRALASVCVPVAPLADCSENHD